MHNLTRPLLSPVHSLHPGCRQRSAAGVDTLSVTFTPTDTTDYTTASKTVQLTVNQTTPIIIWANPATIFYGTPLSTTQLNAAAYQLNGTTPLDGTFVYSPVGWNRAHGRLETVVRYLHPE